MGEILFIVQMKKSKISTFGFFVIFIFLIAIFFVFPILKEKGNLRLITKEIREGYKGVIIEKFSVRDTPPTHLKIETEKGIIKVSPNQTIVEKSKIGDSIIKPKNENFAYLVTTKGVKNKYFYTKLSYETRNSKYFPKEWKNRWMESSEWDN